MDPQLLTRVVLALGIALGCGGCSAPDGTDAPAGRVDLAGLVLVDMQGGEHELTESLADGREVMLVFWQTWCEPCRREAPALARLARDRAASLDVYGVVTGPEGVVDDAEVLRVADELGTGYPQVRDRDAALARRFDVRGTPTILVVGSGGELRYRGHRVPDLRAP